MNNILENFEKDQMQQLMTGKTYPEFNAGDTLKASTLYEEAAQGAMEAGKMKTATEWSLKASELLQ